MHTIFEEKWDNLKVFIVFCKKDLNSGIRRDIIKS